MRRISLALALVGAVAAAGCGGASNKSSNPTGSTGDKGVAEGTFTITIQNGQNNSPGLAIRGGYVTSTPAGIDCGVAPHSACSASFPTDSQVVLTATATAGNLFLGWAADCVGIQATCTIVDRAADQYVLAQFGTEADRTGHPNWSDSADHGPQAIADLANAAGALSCANCHGASLEGAGLAVSCAGCHGGGAQVVAPATTARGEQCETCHSGQGPQHQGIYNRYADEPALIASITAVATSANVDGTFATTVTFTLAKNGAAYDIAGLTQKRYSATRYISYGPGQDPIFETSTAVSFSAAKTTSTAGRYTVKADKAKFNLLAPGTNAFLYFYFGEQLLVPADGHYNLMDNVASVSRVFGTIDYVSTANVSACENCHGQPYMKHGYRAAKVAGLPDMVACKACHTDERVGTDFDWQVLANEPWTLATVTQNGTISAVWSVTGVGSTALGVATAAKYPYVANVMNDTHMSHAMEFAYPQSMANCATCHGGKLDQVFTDANFNGIVCKSCHATTRTGPDVAKRAPSFAGDTLGGPLSHHAFNWANGTITSGGGERQCSYCHSDLAANCSGGVWDVGDPEQVASTADGRGPTCYGYQVPLWRDLHNGGFNRQVYTDETQTVKLAAETFMVIDSATFASSILTVNFHVNAPAGKLIKPTVVISLYGYGTKDFIVNGHGSKAPWTPTTDTGRWLEWAEGASGNNARLAVAPATATVGNANWVATANLTAFSSLLTSGAVTRAEIGVLPVMALDPDAPVSSTNPAVQIGGATATIDLAAGGGIITIAGNNITDAAKCNKCHDGLGVEFHSPSYGSAGTVACRLCHQVGNGGSHLEMQSRSIDSYVHSIHAFQKMDIGSVNFADPVQAMEYRHHTESTYPNFTLLNCESCHNPGTYDVPSQMASLPGILSAASALNGTSRAIGGVPSVVTGPAARACGSCHRGLMIAEDDAAGLAALDSHTKAFGYREIPTQQVSAGVLETTYQLLLRVIDAVF